MKIRIKNKLKQVLTSILYIAFESKLLCKIKDFIVRIDKKYYDRIVYSQNKLLNILSNNSSELVVLNGPFKGLKYPFKEAFGSVFTPKIIGTYELELHSIVNEILVSGYKHIIDIGAAEGYYSIGFAKKCQKLKS